ncbi:helix-turn-helix transcriptional regulator [Paenibacillus kribbensis]|uniref:helix-turn-helix domain-containing protein n=1 Tax=Paenibacillus kribbensis TaxID=172713 RepID=UPI002DBC05A2|nr:helix-turn-helix transcriptional regulator [Paenibacillus kribbensis]MEC0234519.1 helix-turn-helix transcriptional regulator [Paenibacillus kribbensis]
MEITPMIRAEIERYLKQQGITMTEFGHITDLNVGTVSGIVTGNRSISVNQLDRITAGMGLSPDYFYERYIEECIKESPLNWRKISPFLYGCAEHGRLDCIQSVVSLLLDTSTYIPLLFELAEDFFQKAYQDAAALLYENVAESERKQHSERLAVCQYRLFSIRIGKDQIQNLQTAARFEPFVDRLDEIDQLDALKDLVNLYRALSQWDKVYQFAQIMRKRAKICYGMKQEFHKKPSRPPFVYIAYADLLCAYACDARGHYEQGLKHLKAHTDLSWVKEKDPETQHWLGLFQGWAKINTYVNRLMSGDVSVLPDYVEYISGEQEIFAELLNVVEAANRYNLDIDHILERFEPQIAAYQEPLSSDTYIQQVLPEEYVRFWYKMAKYSLNKGRYPYGFKCLINAYEKAVTINHGLLIGNCVGLFERYKAYATPEILAWNDLWERNDQKDGFNLSNG